ncbi:hypothetical protein ACQPYK_44985 [Streptosporangium sp. CA-135522]|uniref:hypothetical protein n=1 Tax=Streptosporangium sp. CA-135522 TaxID=3240072 RepID=UPI003D93C546
MSDGQHRAQAAIQTILRLTNLLMAGKRVAVLGHEPELASCLRAMGAQTLLTDPAAALRGHRVLSEAQAVALADLVIGASGEHLPLLRDGAILASAGSSSPTSAMFDGSAGVRVRDGITAYRLDPDREVFVLDMAC